MVASRRSPNAEDLPLPEQRTLRKPEPATPKQLEARHRKIKDVVVAVAKMLAPK